MQNQGPPNKVDFFITSAIPSMLGIFLLPLVTIGVIAVIVSPFTTPSTNDAPITTESTRELSPQEFSRMSKAEYEVWLREESGYTQRQIEGSLANFEENQSGLLRWYAREGHWANVDAYDAYVNRAMADGVMSLDEFNDACITHPQWEQQLTAARDYVIEFRQFDAHTVEVNPELPLLQRQAENGLQTIAETKATCREQGFQ